MKWIDIPPVWLLLAIALTWWVADVQPAAWAFGGPFLRGLGTGFVMVGLLLIVLAAVEMRKQRTTIIPHMQAAHLVTSGIFARSRNPIYLGDSFVLAGLALRWEAPLALILVPLFMFTITQRLLLAAEEGLCPNFAAEFTRYSAPSNSAMSPLAPHI